MFYKKNLLEIPKYGIRANSYIDINDLTLKQLISLLINYYYKKSDTFE